jgi:hypothetical protein
MLGGLNQDGSGRCTHLKTALGRERATSGQVADCYIIIKDGGYRLDWSCRRTTGGCTIGKYRISLLSKPNTSLHTSSSTTRLDIQHGSYVGASATTGKSSRDTGRYYYRQSQHDLGLRNSPDRIAVPHICPIRREIRRRPQTQRRRTKDRGAAERDTGEGKPRPPHQINAMRQKTPQLTLTPSAQP